MLYRVYVQFRSKTLDDNMEKLNKMIHEQSTDVRAVRALSINVLTGNVKILAGAKSSPYQWFKSRSSELLPFEENFKDVFLAFEAAMHRLESMVPEKWTVLTMGELGRRMLNAIVPIDNL